MILKGVEYDTNVNAILFPQAAGEVDTMLLALYGFNGFNEHIFNRVSP